ncbi:sensor histidine kinase [Microbispora sitophila]|uniref:sensor histidine kinase n=1 Tax=Microbispora sitophila TaxID=2771537 RepID=UPI00299F63E1|nr:ATP-binding protein [Microbispora sitophila]
MGDHVGFGDRWSVRSRIALFTGTVVALLCAAFSIVLVWSLHVAARENLMWEVTAAGGRIAYLVDHGQVGSVLPPDGPDRPVQVVDPQGRVRAATPAMAGKPAMATFRPRAPLRKAAREVCGGVFGADGCHLVVAQQVYNDGGDWTVYSAAPVQTLNAPPALVTGLTVGSMLVTAAVAYGARRSVKRALLPVRAIRAELDEINASDLGRRVPVPEAKGEIHDLAQSVNYTLDRLEETLEQQRRFTSDASHELRSPITAIRAQVEGALLAPQESDLREIGPAVLKSLERLQAIASDLLTLARLDVGAPCERERLDLGRLVAAELDARRPIRRVVSHLAPGVVVRGDRIRLGRLVTNLLDNAERHAATTVRLEVRREDPPDGDPRFRSGLAVLEVLDDGVGIARDQRELVFQRFTRLDTARSRNAGGAGLGLPIARQIAESHGGTLTISDSPRGARFLLRLPLSREP